MWKDALWVYGPDLLRVLIISVLIWTALLGIAAAF